MKFFVHYSYYVECIHHYSNGAATLTNLCHKNILDNVVNTKVTKVAAELFKARMISALVLLIYKSDNKTICIVAIDANEVIAIGVLK